MIQKSHRMIDATIAIGVFQNPDTASGRCFIGTLEVRHEPAHFHNPKPSIFIEAQRDRILHQGFGADQFQTKLRIDRDGLERFGRGQRGGRWRFEFDGGLNFGSPVSQLS